MRLVGKAGDTTRAVELHGSTSPSVQYPVVGTTVVRSVQCRSRRAGFWTCSGRCMSFP